MNTLQSVLMAHAPVLPVLLPLFTAVLLLLLGDRSGGHSHDAEGMALRRRLSLGSAALGLLLAVWLLGVADGGVLQVYRLGEWPAPFGIVLVLDRLSALMLLLTACGSDTTTADVEDAVREQIVERLNRPNTDITLVDVECDPLSSSDSGTKVQCDVDVRNEKGELVPVPVRATLLDDEIAVEPVR